MDFLIWNLYVYMLNDDKHSFDVFYTDKGSSRFIKYYTMPQSKLYQQYKKMQTDNDPFYRQMRERYWKNR